MSEKRVRDPRLLVALLLLVVAAVSLLIQAWISALYVASAKAQNWAYYLELFPSFARPTAPGTYCLDDCSPYHPLLPGGAGVVTFLAGVVVLVFSWWKPKSREPGSGAS
jgi:hypothetical protein